jgi:hypothetical protein
MEMQQRARQAVKVVSKIACDPPNLVPIYPIDQCLGKDAKWYATIARKRQQTDRRQRK